MPFILVFRRIGEEHMPNGVTRKVKVFGPTLEAVSSVAYRHKPSDAWYLAAVMRAM